MNQSSLLPPFALDLGLGDRYPGHPHGSFDVADLRATLRRHRGKLLLWCCFCVGLAVLYLASTPPAFTASTTILLEPVRPVVGVPQDSGRALLSLDAAQAESRIQVLKSERILRFVFDALDLAHSSDLALPAPGWQDLLLARLVPGSPASDEDRRAAAFQTFMGRVGVRRIGQSYVLEVSYTAPDAQIATRTVNSITSAYIWYQIASVGRGSAFLQTRIADLTAQETAALDGVKQGRIPDVLFPDADARVIGAAIKPTSKSFPQSKLVIAFALCFALATGLGVILTANSFDRRIRNRRHVVRHLGLECLAEVPPLSPRRRRGRPLCDIGGVYGDDAVDRALRASRPVLISARLDGRHRAVGLVSWRRREGVTTLASRLAQVVAAASEPVVIIDGNLEDPALTRVLAPNETRGLTDCLLAREAPEDLTLVRLTGHLSLVPAVGEERGIDSNAFVGLPEMHRYIDALRRQASLVVDLPAVSVSSNARVLGPMLDGVILVIEASRTTIDEAHDCLTALRDAKVAVLGAILNRTGRSA